MTVPNSQEQNDQQKEQQEEQQDNNQQDNNQQEKQQDGQQKTTPKRVGDLNFEIPEAYKKEAWTEGLKTIDDVWTKLAGAQKLIGKKGIIPPSQNSSKEEWDAFYNAQGRPENVEGYEFKNIEELKDVNRNTVIDHEVKKLFHEEGISKEKAERIVSKFEKIAYTYNKPLLEKAAKTEQEFQQMTKEILGSERESTLKAFKDVMRETLGEKTILAQKLEELDNNSLLALTVFAKNIHDKYVGENKIPVVPGSNNNLTGDLRTDFQTLSKQKVAIKMDKNIPEHIKSQKILQLNNQMIKIGQKAKDNDIDLFS